MQLPNDFGRKYTCNSYNADVQVEYVNCYMEDKNKLLGLRDPLTSKWPDSLWHRLMEIGQKCTAQLKKHRPSMSSVCNE